MEPVIKVRYKDAFFLALLIPYVCTAAYTRCDKRPLETAAPRAEGSNGFGVTIVGKPLLYRPNTQYKIMIKSVGSHISKFEGFFLVAEPKDPTSVNEHVNLGTFQLFPGDAMVKFSHRCSHAVEATSSTDKTEVMVFWAAPPRGTGCIMFKAMVEEMKDVWYEDEGSLTYELCEDTRMEEPSIVNPCCACDEAKYEAIFEGIWSRHTHPKDFPADEWRTGFSHIIGASHSLNYSLFDYGVEASKAMIVLGEHGVTRGLEEEMKRHSLDIRSVIKAHGLQQRSNVEGQTFAVFRVDPLHHLISLVSKMTPSPDWIVGLSKESLCLPNCSWVPFRVIELYPWDIGTQSGLRYDSPNMPTRKKQPIQRITSSNPANPESPFYDKTSAPMQPAAVLHLIRQRQYNRACPPGHQRPPMMGRRPPNSWRQPGGSGGGGYGTSGGMSGAGQFRPGYGNNANSYMYGGRGGRPTDQERYNYANANNFNEYGGSPGVGGGGPGATDYDSYSGGVQPPQRPPSAVPQSPYSPDGSQPQPPGSGWNTGSVSQQNQDPCAVSEYGPWSDCSATCGAASRDRKRDFLNPNAARINACQMDLLIEKKRCYLPDCPTQNYGRDNSVDTSDTSSGNIFNPFFVDDEYNKQGSQKDNPFNGLKSVGLLDGRRSYTYNPRQVNPPNPVFDEGGVNQDYGDSRSRYGGGNGYHGAAASNAQPVGDPYFQRNTYLMDDATDQSGVNKMIGDEGAEFDHLQDELDHDFTSSSYGAHSYIYGGEGTSEDAPRYSQLNQAAPEESDCRVSEWGTWSDCSMECGKGFKTRQRRYLNRLASSSCGRKISDQANCYGQAPHCEQSGNDAAAESDWRRAGTLDETYDWSRHGGSKDVGVATEVVDSGPCDVAEWSQWSPCSQTCGTGKKQRTRLFRLPFVPDRVCDVKLIDRAACADPNCPNFYSYQSSSMGMADEPETDMGYELGVYRMVEGFEESPLEDEKDGEEDICQLDPDVGPCSGHFLRWYFDGEAQECREFYFRGCEGNKNNFGSKADCRQACQENDRRSWHNEEDPFRKLKALSSVKLDSYSRPSSDISIDCQVSSWTEWSECSNTCGVGWTQRHRSVMVEPAGGGQACPRKLIRRRKCRLTPCKKEPYWYADEKYRSPWLDQGER